MGYYWHPVYVTSCSPEPVSFNAGAPFILFCRVPQVRITRQLGSFKQALGALSQVDLPSNGPDGPSPKYLRNSVSPEFTFKVQCGLLKGEKKTEFMVGGGIDYLVLTPKLSAEVIERPAFDPVINNLVVHNDAIVASYKTNTKSTALMVNFFVKLKLPATTIKTGGVYGGNCYAFCMLGGYAVKSLTDSLHGIVDYAAIHTASSWIDLTMNGQNWSAGIYGGMRKNLGAYYYF